MHRQQSIVHRPIFHRPADVTRDIDDAAPTRRRRLFWFALLVAAGVAFSLGFACAVPFAALGTAAALTLPRRQALLVAGVAWLANQVAGFTLLNYPWAANTLAWGVALGVVAVLATATSLWLIRRLDGQGAVVVVLASFLGAFVMYEGGLFVVAAALLGGTEDFVSAIIARIFEINAAAFAGLLVLNQLAIAGGLADKPVRRFTEHLVAERGVRHRRVAVMPSAGS